MAVPGEPAANARPDSVERVEAADEIKLAREVHEQKEFEVNRFAVYALSDIVDTLPSRDRISRPTHCMTACVPVHVLAYMYTHDDIAFMPNSSHPRMVREPVQVYLAPDDSDLLNRLAKETSLSKAEILRRGIRSFAAEQGGPSPMLRFLSESTSEGWPVAVAAEHDKVLAESYHPPAKKRR